MDNADAIILYGICLINFDIFTHIIGHVPSEVIGEYAAIIGIFISSLAIIVKILLFLETEYDLLKI